MVEFGITVGGYVPKHKMDQEGDEAEHNAYMQGVELVREADRHNWKYVWFAEHHFLKEYSHLSATEVYLGYCAAVTSKIHLGSGIFSFSPMKEHPVRIAERVAMLDHLTEGRFEFGMGRGAGSYEVMGFGLEGTEATRAIWDECAAQMPRMLSGEQYSHDGTSFRVPHPDSPSPTRLILPRPWKQPHPPMWVAAGSPPTFEKAARLGLGVLAFSIRPILQMAPLVAQYKALIADAEPLGAYVNDNAMVATMMICLEDGQKARRLACDIGLGRYQSLVFYYHDAVPRPEGVIVWPEIASDPTLEDVEDRIRQGVMICGDPDECVEQVRAAESIGIDQLALAVQSGVPQEAAVESVRLFGDYVIPKFDRDPVHRSTKWRNAAASTLSEL
jgi:alkanesulfonate monooxygenase SsuD/methylene tetrahydromethanopterin reductase-like flavin-dependent oxidoreductase (luciferase family)